MELARAAWITSFPGFKTSALGISPWKGKCSTLVERNLFFSSWTHHLSAPIPLFKLLQLQSPSKALQLQQESSCWGQSKGFTIPAWGFFIP